MAITGISAISGEQIIAAGAISAKEAATAAFTTGGNDIQSLYNTVSTNSASWTASGPSYTGDAQGALDEVYTNSGDWNTVTDKLNATAFSTVSGSFLTAHQTLPNSANWDSTYTTVSTNSADWNSAAAMNELPVSAGQGMEIQNVDGNIVFSCTGGSVPEGVLVESGLEYNANNEISGYSGSAFAQPSISAAEWNSNYETVNTNSGAWGGPALPISAGPGVRVEMVDNTLVFSNDEKVLWSGTAQSGIQLNEPITNFGRIGILFGKASNSEIKFFDTTRSSEGLPLQLGATFSNSYASTYTQTWVFTNSTTLTTGQKAKEWWGNAAGVSSRDTTDMPIYKVIGINRTAWGN